VHVLRSRGGETNFQALEQRQQLLPGETARKRLGIPMFMGEVRCVSTFWREVALYRRGETYPPTRVVVEEEEPSGIHAPDRQPGQARGEPSSVALLQPTMRHHHLVRSV
jgi:hypothetical protein